MNIMYGPRGCGKTTTIIRYAAANGSYIVCRNKSVCESISRKAKSLDLVIPFPITYEDFISGRFYSPNINSFMIDDIDELLTVIARNTPVVFGTLTSK